MSSDPAVRIREFTAADLDAALALWSRSEGVGLNESDTPEDLRRFLDRNPGLSAVATSADGRLIGAALCGHDGRRGAIHHLVVAPPYRRRGVALRLLERCFRRLEQAHVSRCNVFVYHDNAEGMEFWRRLGFEPSATWSTLQKRLS
jgi:ribosomal protein S18 acetylase RimI-like enzyme